MIKKNGTSIKTRSLAQIEASIEVGHKSFIQLGEDYKAIRDGDYAEAKKAVSNRSLAYADVMEKVLGYPTLAKYWKGKWNLTIQHINQVIASSEVMKELGERDLSANVAGKLAKTPKAKRKATLAKAKKNAEKKGKPVTGKDIDEANNSEKTPNNVTTFPEVKLDATTFREELNALLKRYVGRISRNTMSEIMDSISKNIKEGKKVA